MTNQDNQWHIRCNSIKKAAAKRILHEIKEPTGFMVDFLVYAFNDDYYNLMMNKFIAERRMEEINNEIIYMEERMRFLKNELTGLKVKHEIINNDMLYFSKKEFEEFND